MPEQSRRQRQQQQQQQEKHHGDDDDDDDDFRGSSSSEHCGGGGGGGAFFLPFLVVDSTSFSGPPPLGPVGVGATEDDGGGEEDFLPNGLANTNFEDDTGAGISGVLGDLGLFLSIASTPPSSFSTSNVKNPDLVGGLGVIVPPLLASFLKLNFIVRCCLST